MRYRALAIPLVGITAVLLGVLMFGNVNDNLVYYLTPTEAIAKKADFPDGKRFRLGGLVQEGSVSRADGGLSFIIASGDPDGPTVRVSFRGAPSQLFQPGIGVIVEGSWQGSSFVSDTMIVKHDEEYRPPGTGTTAPPPPAVQGRAP